MSRSLNIGASAPSCLRARIKPGPTLPDLTDVTDAAFVVTRRNGVVETWDAEIVSQTQTELVIKHVLAANGAETPTRDDLRCIVQLTASDGVHRCAARLIPVRPL